MCIRYSLSDSAAMKIEEEEEDITEEQLRRWVRSEVEKDERVTGRRAQLVQVEEWVKQKERENTYTHLLYSSACESVLECESVMKGLYGMLGLEYRDTDSEEDEGAKSAMNIIQVADEEHNDAEVESDGDDDYVVIDLGATVPESLEDESKVQGQSAKSQTSVEVLDSRVIKTETLPQTIMPPTTTSTPYKNIAEFFRQFTNGSQINKESSPPGSPEPSTDCLEIIKKRESPVPICSVPSPSDLPPFTFKKGSPTSLPINSSENEIMEPPTLTIPSAFMNGTEHQEASASETSACRKQDVDTSEQPVVSTKALPSAKSDIASGLSEKVLIKTTLDSDGKSSNTHICKTTVTEKSKSNQLPPSATCSTQTNSKPLKDPPTEKGTAVSSIQTDQTKNTTSSTKAQSMSSAKPTQPVASTSAISAHKTGVSRASSVTSSVTTRVQPKVELKVNMSILGKRRTKTWHQGTIVEIRATESGQRYKVQFEEGKGKSVLSGHHLACVGSPTLKDLFVGCRVVACYKEEQQSWLYAAVVTEMPDRKNRMRFLVFFDDGRPAYVSLPQLHLVCAPLNNVCDDIDDVTCRAQVEEYLQSYPNPVFVMVQVGQESNVECEGKMEPCTIIQVDGSLIQVRYKKHEEKEWLYKGSNKLEHIQRVKKKMAEKKKSSSQGRFIQRNITTPTTAATSASTSTTSTDTVKTSASQKGSPAVATVTSSLPAKATIPISQPMVTLHRIDVSKTGTKRPASEEDQSGQAPVLEAQLKYVPHRCCPACLDQTRPARKDEHLGKNPLLIPLLYGFRRVTARKRLEGKMSFDVFYRSPCGRSMCNMEQVQDFLFESRCDFLFLEMFCMDPFVLVRRAQLPSSVTPQPHLILPDISQGKEVIPVPCVNEVDATPPVPVTYTRYRIPSPSVLINTSPDFMMGCDCMDGCRDRSKCSCHQLTIEATSLFPGGPVDASAGYMHKRLTRDLPTGVYECNPLCRCDPWMCSNRLVQHGLRLRLEVFMTRHKGWGIRCLDDLSKGTFVCVFTGKIVTDENALSGNEFLANLDFIEGVEKLKEGYETEAYCSDKERESDKRTLVTMTTGALKKPAAFTRDSDSSGCEEKMKTNEQKMKEKGAAKMKRRKAGNNQKLYPGCDDMDDEDYVPSSDDEDYKPSMEDGECKHLKVDSKKSYVTRRNVKIMDAVEDMELETKQSSPKISENQTVETSLLAKQMRKEGHCAVGFARKSTRPLAGKSIHRKPKPEETSKEPGMKSASSRSTRGLFAGEKACYLIDAKQEGNIARYINHSCRPNLFVQNVFVDTHDLRFPWVAFFTSKRIRAGTELTWDYSYEVGSVEGKVLLCCCGSDECTGRLL